MGRRDLWLGHVGTESRCDPSRKRDCSAQSPRLRHVSSQAPWPGGLGENCSRWSGVSGSFLISPGSLVSLPSQPASAQQPPRREAGGLGPAQAAGCSRGRHTSGWACPALDLGAAHTTSLSPDNPTIPQSQNSACPGRSSSPTLWTCRGGPEQARPLPPDC